MNWFKEKYLKHAASGSIHSHSYKNKKIFFTSPAEFLHTFREIFGNEIYKAELPENAYVIDCGANIGIGTLYIKEICPSARIIAFEPDKKNFELLRRNVEVNNLQHVTCREEAVWIEDTTLNFSSEGTMGSKIDTGQSESSHNVKAVRLKYFLNQEVDLLKIDIEGAEYRVLKDIAPDLLNVKQLFLEYHGKFEQMHELTEIFVLLQNQGFKYYIQEAAPVYQSPFMAGKVFPKPPYDIQLNIFCTRQIQQAYTH